jgi:hypothetical protein
VRIGTALVVGFDAGDCFVEPGGNVSHKIIIKQMRALNYFLKKSKMFISVFE